jgi:hypothetical protein
MLHLRLIEKRISEAFVFFRQCQIEPVLIKGWSAAHLYPQPYQRRIGDIDLMVAPELFEDAAAYLKNFKDKQLIDLHCGARHLDLLPFEKLFANSKTIKCGETDVRVLRPEDHLRILCVHWLTDGGEHREKLWDIYYAVENRPADFDWERCLDAVGETRKKWITCCIVLANKYLGLNLDGIPLPEESREIPQWLLETIEKEWKSDLRLKPLEYCLSDKKQLFSQIKKRFPPNPIQATVEMEGEFDYGWRVKYQIGSILYRVKPSVKRIWATLQYSYRR